MSQAVDIPDNDAYGANLNYNVVGSQIISAVAICINIDHSWVGDLTITLIHQDTGTAVTLVARVGNPAFSGNCPGNGAGMYVLLDDFESGTMQQHCTSTSSELVGYFKPDQALSAFNGENQEGTWILNVADLYPGDTGVIRGSVLTTYHN